MGEVNRAWRLAAHPKGDVSPADFELTEEPLPQIEDGQILVRNLYLSVDPAMRVWITGRKTYVDGVQVGQVMPSSAVGRIVESKRTGFEVGEHVVGMFGWRDYCATDGRGLVPINKIPPGIRVTAALGTLGINGLTAYFGLLDVGQLEPGQTVLVSGAAGATGSIAGQIAKAKDCRVIGIAGGEQKCNWLTGEAHFDAAVDYKADGALEQPARLAVAELTSAAGLIAPRHEAWRPRVLASSAHEERGIAEVWEQCEAFFRLLEATGALDAERSRQTERWLLDEAIARVTEALNADPALTTERRRLVDDVRAGRLSVYRAAARLVALYRESGSGA